MKRFVATLFTLIILFSTTIAMATNDKVQIKRGDEFLKDSLSKWEDIGERSVIDMFGEFLQKGFPTLSRAEANRLIINILIFSCIANVGIVIYLLKQDKNKEDKILDSRNNDFYQVDKKRSKLVINAVKAKHPEFDENLFWKEVKKLFEKHFEEMQSVIDDGVEHHIEKAKVREVEAVRYFTDEGKEKIVVVLKASMIEYWVDVKTKEIVKGSNKSLKQEWYKATLIVGGCPLKVSCYDLPFFRKIR